MKFIFLVFFTGCIGSEPKKKFSANEIKYLASLDIESRVYIDDCMKFYERIPSHCIRELRKLGKPEAAKTESGSVLKTATGVALGYGAAKMILGK